MPRRDGGNEGVDIRPTNAGGTAESFALRVL